MDQCVKMVACILFYYSCIQAQNESNDFNFCILTSVKLMSVYLIENYHSVRMLLPFYS